jgi:hypothetical protein
MTASPPARRYRLRGCLRQMIGRDWLNSDSVAHAYLPSAPESGDSAVRVLFRFLPGSDHGRAQPVIGGWALVSGSRPGPGRRACISPWPYPGLPARSGRASS